MGMSRSARIICTICAFLRWLLDGGLSTALRHRATRQEMNFLDLFATIPELWMEAKASHRSKNER